MFDNYIRKFGSLPLDRQIYVFCLVLDKPIPDTDMLNFIEFVKRMTTGKCLSQAEIIQITELYERIKPRVEWGKELKNNQIIESFGISHQVPHKIMCDYFESLVQDGRKKYRKFK
jgi:hypothetical protein